MLNSNDATKKDHDAIDTALKNYTDAAKSVQAIAVETAGYSQKSFQDAVAHVETLSSVKSLEAAFELQSNFAKTYYESFVAEAAKIGEMYAGLAKSVCTPYQSAATKAAAASKDSLTKAA